MASQGWEGSFLSTWLALSDMLCMGEEGLTVSFSITCFQVGKHLEGLRNQTLSGTSSFSITGNLQDKPSLQGYLGCFLLRHPLTEERAAVAVGQGEAGRFGCWTGAGIPQLLLWMSL